MSSGKHTNAAEARYSTGAIADLWPIVSTDEAIVHLVCDLVHCSPI